MPAHEVALIDGTVRVGNLAAALFDALGPSAIIAIATGIFDHTLAVMHPVDERAEPAGKRGRLGWGGGPKIDVACLDFEQLEKLRIYYQEDYRILNSWYSFEAIFEEWKSGRKKLVVSEDSI